MADKRVTISDSDIGTQLSTMLKAIAKGANEFDTTDAKVDWAGSKIVLPDTPKRMTYEGAIGWLTRLKTEENKEVNVHEEIKAFPLDGAVAFSKALKEIYGWASPTPTPGFFGPRPPTSVAVQTDVDEYTEVFWGGFEVPNVEGMLHTNADFGGMKFFIQGSIKVRSLGEVKKIAAVTRRILAESSIYRAKAINLNLNKNGDFDVSTPPAFLDVRSTREEELIFSEALLKQVRTNLFAPVEFTERCRALSIPLKRGVLLEGPFGTGKTLCAAVTAKKAVQNGWTFITVGRVSALHAALKFAQMYQPCVLFVEDIDREMAGGRTAQMDDILNTIDGVVSKSAEIMVVLTSNNAEAINPAMLRPGRLDAVLHIGPPDADATEKLMRLYGRGLIAESETLDAAKTELAGQIPATIREAVERAKLWAVSRGDTELHLTDSDILGAAQGMKRHLELLNRRPSSDKSPEYALGEAMGRLVNHTLANGHDDGFVQEFRSVAEQVKEVHAATV